MNIEEDYVPSNKPEDLPSEEESDGIEEDELSEGGETEPRKKRKGKTPKRRRKKQKQTFTASLPKKQPEEEKSVKEAKEDKEDIVDIWADFIKDTGFQSKSNQTKSVKKNSNKTDSIEKKTKDDVAKNKPIEKKAEKLKITQVFQFAGEEVAVEKEVPTDLAEARLFSDNSETSKTVRPKRTGLSGIGGVLSQLGKKPKISTLEKTKLDWDRYKKEENIEEELHNYNKGKDGFLERQDFLQRADLRRFEIEKDIRAVERSKRLNNV